MFVRKRHEQGQILLVVLLAMATIVTLSLSVVSRSVTDVSVTAVEDESLRAFSAAEAGVEEALVQAVPVGASVARDLGVGLDDPDPLVTEEANYTAVVDRYPKSAFGTDYVYPFDLVSGESATLWLVEHNDTKEVDDSCGASTECFADTEIRLCWGNPGTADNTSETPAVEFSIVYEDTGLQIARVALDPHSGSRPGTNKFQSVGGGGCNNVGEENRNFEFRYDVDLGPGGFDLPAGVLSGFGGGLKYVKARLLYNTNTPQSLAFISSSGSPDVFPAQGKIIDSTGTSGDANRRVEVITLFPEPPSVFDSAVFSGTSVTK